MWFAKVDGRDGTFVISNPDFTALKLPLVKASCRPRRRLTATPISFRRRVTPAPAPMRADEVSLLALVSAARSRCDDAAGERLGGRCAKTAPLQQLTHCLAAGKFLNRRAQDIGRPAFRPSRSRRARQKTVQIESIKRSQATLAAAKNRAPEDVLRARRTRAISARAAGQSAMLRKPKATVTTSKLPAETAAGVHPPPPCLSGPWLRATLQHLRAKIGARDFRLPATFARSLGRDRRSRWRDRAPGAAAIRLTISEARSPPPEIEPAAEQMIGQIVAPRDAAKHGPDRDRIAIDSVDNRFVRLL